MFTSRLRMTTSTVRIRRGGVVMVLFAFMLLAMIGMLGLVIDGGFLMATHRQVQNAADASALAAAYKKFRGGSDADAITVADTFIQTHNGLTNAPGLVNNSTFNAPPANGPYAGNTNYVETIVTAPVQTMFIHVLGISRTNNVTARAVAGWEAVSAGEGVIVLDRYANPGLSVGGDARLRVNGRVIVNSAAGGVEENGIAVTPLPPLPSGSVAILVNTNVAQNGEPATGIYANLITVEGGAQQNSLSKMYMYKPPGEAPDLSLGSPYDGDSVGEPDPLLPLPTPVSGAGSAATDTASATAPGVDAYDYESSNEFRGNVGISSNGIQGDIHSNYNAGESSQISGTDYADTTLMSSLQTTFVDADGNFIFADVRPTGFLEDDVILFPGIYRSIDITGGNVFLIPGIYVLSPDQNTTTMLSVGGAPNSPAQIIGRGVMIYNTGDSYAESGNHANGTPDKYDLEQLPGTVQSPLTDGTDYIGRVTITKDAKLSPINTDKYLYSSYYTDGNGNAAPAVSSEFNGILFYNRRRNNEPYTITGNAANAQLTGTIYAKWSNFALTGSGAFDAQFVVGSLSISGGGDLTVLGAGDLSGKANQIFLVE